MAEQTTSSIVIDAPAAEVMAVIADFAAYPEWAQGMKQAEVVDEGTGGRADKVHFELDATPIRDSYTLAYDWKGDSSVTWVLTEGKMLKAMEGAYVLKPSGSGDRGHLPPGRRPEHPDDRPAASARPRRSSSTPL